MFFIPQDGNTPLFQLTTCLAGGLFFASICNGFLYFLLFLIIIRIIVTYCQTIRDQRYYYTCFGCILMSFLGFLLGRVIVGDHHPFNWVY